MTAPRLEIDLHKVHHNTRSLVEHLGRRGITVTGVTKATLGSPEIARALLRAGVSGIGDSRIENIEGMVSARVPATMTLIRSPMLSQVERVVRSADVSCNTELDVIRALSAAATSAGKVHGVVLMVELGDLREGIMPTDLPTVVREVLTLPGVELQGIGTNLACQSGACPDARNMAELSQLADQIEAECGVSLRVVSGGNSANLDWALSGNPIGRINDLRLGEAILLGREPLRRRPIDGLHPDAITLVAEVIESMHKPSAPWGEFAQTAFGERLPASDRGDIWQSLVAVGEQDTDPSDLHAPHGLEVMGASSDHLVVDAGRRLPIGTEIRFRLGYSALVWAMTSPFVAKVVKVQSGQVHVATA